MSILSQIITKTISYISANDIYGITKIHAMAFHNSQLISISIPDTCKMISKLAFNYCEKLTTITIPSSVEVIGQNAFSQTSSLKNSSFLNNLNPNCKIRGAAFSGAYFFENATSNIYGGNGKILIKAVSSSWPSGITNLAANSCDALVSGSKLVIPDTITILGGDPLDEANDSLTHFTISKNISQLIYNSIPRSITTLICRQPAGMFVDVPSKSGDGYGLSWTKNGRNMTLYTDNEYIKNYDWAGDNITVTIYPLSQAPT